MRPKWMWLLAAALPLLADDAATAARNARQASAAAWLSHRVTHAWLKRTDPVTGLLPRMGPRRQTDPNWVVKDSAADLYPFLVIDSFYLEPALYQNEMPRILRQEMLLSNRVGRLADDVQPGGKGWVYPNPDMDRIIFGSSEYAKDGLLPLTELLGETPWYERLRGIATDIVRKAPYKTAHGMLPARTSEINGNMLQVLSRLYSKTREPEYLDALTRLADFYLLDQMPKTNWLPADTWDFERNAPAEQRPIFILSDHGNEIVGGLSEAMVAAERFRPDKAREYREPFRKMIDRVLETGRNADGVWVSRLELKTGKVVDGRHAHCWGYMFNGIYTAWMLTGDAKYRDAVGRAIHAVTAKPEYLFDETGAGRGWGANAYSDSIESALVLLNRIPDEHFAAAIDEATAKFLKRVPDDGIVEDWYGDGNFVRTAMMYVFWKTQGTWITRWTPRVHLGAVRQGEGLMVHLAAEAAWQGKLRFDRPRHRDHFGLGRNYPRLNEWPEWFTVEADRAYTVEIAGRPQRTYFGWDLMAGIPLEVEGGESVNVMVRPR